MTSPLDPYAAMAEVDACATEWCVLPDGHGGTHEDTDGEQS